MVAMEGGVGGGGGVTKKKSMHGFLYFGSKISSYF